MLSAFDHRPDRELGEALKALLSSDDDEGFTSRVLARVAALQNGITPAVTWWEVLSGWARPGLVAAGLGLALGATVWFSGLLSGGEGTVALGDPLQPPEDSTFPAALLARSQPPLLNEVLVVGLEGR